MSIVPLPQKSLTSAPLTQSVSSVMRSLESAVSGVAPTDFPVLIIGEEGTDKRALAERLHAMSLRNKEPFKSVRCAETHADRLQSDAQVLTTLGAMSAAPGMVAGTAFLEELGDLTLECQARFFKVLSSPKIFPLPRIISGTTRDLQGDIKAGRFREDLFYHLSAVCLRIPPLRQRREDIASLFEHLLSAHSAALGMQKPELSEELVSLIELYDWPGNLRELENAAKTSVVAGLKAGLAPIRDAVAHESEATVCIPLKRAARAASLHAQRELILQALSKTSWNRKRAAEHLQISYKALLYKMREIGLVPASGKVE